MGGESLFGPERRRPDARVLFRLLPACEGGQRAGAVLSGYRPAYQIRNDYWTSAYHQFHGVEALEPGEQAEADVWLVTPDVYPGTLWVGREIKAAEGSRLVGIARVLEVYNPDLARNGS